MNEKEGLTIYSYSKVWKIEKKIYAIQNIVLPVPIAPYSILYFVLTLLIFTLLSNFLPFLKHVPFVFRFLVIPFGITTFLEKIKFDGKSPIKYLFDYIKYLLFERYTYIERFNERSIVEEKYKINWKCSMRH